jgi:phosphomannomutase
MLTTIYLLAEARQLKNSGSSLAQRLQEWRQRYAWSGERNFRLSQPAELFPVLEAVAHAARELIPGALRKEVRLDPHLGLPRVFPAGSAPYQPAEMPCPDLKLQSPANEAGGCWLVLRPSGNEGMLRLNIETWGQLRNRCPELYEKTSSLLSALGALALS